MRADGTPKTRYRSIFVSDIHLGSPSSKSGLLVEFLETTRCENLYIVGDFIDFYHLYEHHGWSSSCNQVIRRLLSKVGKKTQVKVCIGNHDAFLGLLSGFGFGNVKINHEFIHENKFTDYLVTHGDRFDYGLRFSPLTKVLSFLGLHLHNVPMVRWVKRLSDRLSTRTTCLTAIKRKALELGVGGCVIGHTHTPGYREDGNIWNCGDWVEHCTAVVENDNHEMSMFTFEAAEKPLAENSR